MTNPAPQLVSISDWAGIDESVDDAAVATPRMRRAENCVWPNGSGGVQKRNGFTALTSLTQNGATLVSLNAIGSAQGSLVAFDQRYAYSYSPSANRHLIKGKYSPCVVRHSAVTTGNIRQIVADPVTGAIEGQLDDDDSAEIAGFRVVAWVTRAQSFAHGGGFYATVIDTVSGATIEQAFLLANYGDVNNLVTGFIKCIGRGTNLWVVYSTQSGVFYRNYDTVLRAWQGESLLYSDGVGGVNLQFDITPNVGTTEWHFAVYDAVATRIHIARMNSGGGTILGTNVNAIAANVSLTIRCISAERLWLIYGSGVNTILKCIGFNPSILTISDPVFTVTGGGMLGLTGGQCKLGVERIDATHALVTYTQNNTAGNLWGFGWSIISNTTGLKSFGSGAVGAMSTTFQWTRITGLSKPWKGPNGQIYCEIEFDSVYQSTQMVIELNQDTALSIRSVVAPVAVFTPRSSTPNGDYQNGISRPRNRAQGVIGDSTQTLYTMNCNQLTSKGSQGIGTLSVDFAHPSIGQCVDFGHSTYFAGGCVQAYDGLKPVEAGFIMSPSIVSPAQNNAGGQMGKFVYQYVVTYKKTMANGEYLRSPPTIFAPLTLDFTGSATSTNQATLTLTNLTTATFMQDAVGAVSTVNTSQPIQIEIWRTSVIAGTPTTTFYLLQTIANNVVADTTTYVDSVVTDTLLQTQETLYTTGNVFEWHCPPGLTSLVSHNNRLWGIGPDGRTIWYTTQGIDGELPRFNDALKIYVADGGDLTALASLDGTLYAFKKDRTFIIQGEGPSDTGAGSDLTSPHVLPFGVGCSDPRSIVSYANGLAVATDKGMNVFARGGGVNWLGARFQRTTGTLVPSVFLHFEDMNWLLYCYNTSNQNGANGVVILHDYSYDRMSVWKIGTSHTSTAAAFKSGCTVGGRLYLLSVDASGNSDIVYYDPTTWLDTGLWVTRKITSGWIKPGQELGEMNVSHVLLSCQYQSAHGLSVTWERDYVTPDVGPVFSEANTAGMGIELLDMALLNRKCSAFGITLIDTPPAVFGSGRACDISGCTIEITGLPGRFKLIPAAQKG